MSINYDNCCICRLQSRNVHGQSNIQSEHVVSLSESASHEAIAALNLRLTNELSKEKQQKRDRHADLVMEIKSALIAKENAAVTIQLLRSHNSNRTNEVLKYFCLYLFCYELNVFCYN